MRLPASVVSATLGYAVAIAVVSLPSLKTSATEAQATVVARQEVLPPFSPGAADAGLEFVYFNGMSGRFYAPEVVGGGAALFDFDNDGDLDLYVVQGRMLGSAERSEATVPARSPLSDRLYRNDLTLDASDRRRLRLVDVTATSGIRGVEYGMGGGALQELGMSRIFLHFCALIRRLLP